MCSGGKQKGAVAVYPHMAWYVIVAALLVVPALIVHTVVTWRLMFGTAVAPAQAASPSRQQAAPTDDGPVMVRDR